MASSAMFAVRDASSAGEAAARYEELACRLIGLGFRLRSHSGTGPERGTVATTDRSDSRAAAIARGAVGTSFQIEEVSNGYIVRDAEVGDTWLISEEDPLVAAANLLFDLNVRLGSSGDPSDPHRVVVKLEEGENWLEAHPHRCSHEAIRNLSSVDSERWACACGLQFLPVRPDRARKAPG